MSSRLAIALFAAGTVIAPVKADPNFVGHWSQAASERRCSVVLGFALRADGTASVDWAAPGRGSGAKFRSVAGRRDGKWTSSGNTLHLVIIEVVSNRSTEVDVDGSISGDNRLESHISDNRDRNIDGGAYSIRCVYLRD